MNSPDEEKSQRHQLPRKSQLLKATREEKGVSVETVHEMTKIPMDVLRAIEEGYTVRMVSPYYFKGFVKMYAQYLGVDPKEVIEDALPATPPLHPASRPAETTKLKFNEFVTRQKKKQLILTTGASVLVLGFVWIVVGTAAGILANRSKGSERTVTKEPVKSKPAGNSAREKQQKEKTPKSKVAEKPAAVDVKAAVPAPEQSAKVEPPPVAPASEKKEQSKKITLTIKSKGAGWLQVKVDGVLVFQSTMREGASETWEGEKTIELSGKNINNLEFELNGKILGPLGRADRGARRVVVTAEGLSVKK